METVERNLRKEISEKLKDEILRGALGRFAETYPEARAKAYENAGDIETLRDAVRQMKIATVAQIFEVADRFEAEATKRGVKVFRAKTADDAKAYLADLCKEKGVKRIVKSKSMASEEIHLNPHLEAVGITVTETDLGEWIVAIAGHKPSHMVIPAIHLNRFQVAEYFTKELKEAIPPDIDVMVRVARKELREKFLRADMGISGANFAIAENGAIGLVTNEGNAEMVTTLPRIQVAIFGYEKLIPTIRDAATILKVLPRSAAGQLMSSYMTMVSGPTPIMVKRDRKWVEEKKEMHIILLDNGRLKAAKDEKFKEIFQCVRCASCLNVCPVYTLIGGHVYGHIYAGGIGAILTALLHGMKEFEQFHELCIGCRNCTTICPGKIDIPGLIEELRIRKINEKGLSFLLKQAFENVISNRKLFHSLLRLAAVGQKPFQSGRLIRHLPLFLAGLAKDRSLPAIAAEPLRDRIGKITKKISKLDKRVVFFGGCTIDFVFPETGESVFTVLQDLNMEVLFPEGQSCCGKPVIAMGDVETTKKIARENIKALDEQNPDVIIAACPTCTESLRHYAELLKEDPEWGPKAEAMANKVREFCNFVAEEYQKRGRLKKGRGGPKVTYHDSCHMKRVLMIEKEPRQLLEAAGCELVEMKDADKCCGMSGLFGVKYAELSMPILEQKIANIRETGAEIAACACSGCMVQIQGGLDKQLPGVRMMHVADILAEKIRGKALP
jgi:L-lactate dehydrogenase complex protein LldF